MAVAVSGSRDSIPVPPPVTAVEAAALEASDVFARLGSGTEGLAEGEAARRLLVVGPNAVRSYRAGHGTRVANPDHERLPEQARTGEHAQAAGYRRARTQRNASEGQIAAGWAGISNISRPQAGLSPAPHKINKNDLEW